MQFVRLGRVILNLANVCAVTRGPEGQVTVRMTNLGATERGGSQDYTPGEHVFFGADAEWVWERFARLAEEPARLAS
jgi:hypothetical protein